MAESLDAVPDAFPATRLAPFKSALVAIGRSLPGSMVLHMQAALNYLLLGHWLRHHGFRVEHRARQRSELYEYVAKRIGDRQTLYVEFGVYQGASIRHWSRLLVNPGSLLHGFDSFEGLPEDFDMRTGLIKGAFSVGGTAPQIDDPRVRFFKGWFDDTLPAYQVPPHEQLVIHIDCDLYSGAVCVLKHLARYIVPGTILLFDDMGQPQHEPRAFTEYLREHQRTFRLIAADREGHFAFQCTG